MATVISLPEMLLVYLSVLFVLDPIIQRCVYRKQQADMLVAILGLNKGTQSALAMLVIEPTLILSLPACPLLPIAVIHFP